MRVVPDSISAVPSVWTKIIGRSVGGAGTERRCNLGGGRQASVMPLGGRMTMAPRATSRQSEGTSHEADAIHTIRAFVEQGFRSSGFVAG